ncbi:MAG: 4-alpha-glucanotransferase [Gammaproteobacteria bacterium]|nr:4-alpha-glucanotransferase [Gammaproteobacteria bacterium]
MQNPLIQRRAGVLLHPTSLPGKREHGDLGEDARRFIDFLQAAGLSVWQMLPLGPTHADGSPYQCLSVHAGNPALVSLDDLLIAGWLPAATASNLPLHTCLQQAHSGFEKAASQSDKAAYAAFKTAQTGWLDDYALYQAIRAAQDGQPWYQWPVALRDRDPTALADVRDVQAEAIEQVCFEQYLFFTQWSALRDYAHQRGVALFGDMPIYVAHDSADVWAHRELFTIDSAGELEVVAGVPPDYFSETGQRWGNPLYRWDCMSEQGYGWWVERFTTQFAFFDIVRIDHFRGFEKYWEIPASAETAVDGCWVAGPGAALFERLQQHFGKLPVVAEDLGIITPEVDALRLQFGFPGMKILQFAFDGGEDNPYLPQNHEALSVVYTGTHDNDTTLGWYDNLDDAERENVNTHLSAESAEMPWALIRTALESTSVLAIIPMQDLLGMGSDARMNAPGTTTGNWSWRFTWDQVSPDLARKICSLNRQADRVENS